MPEPSSALVILSGGQDSTTALFWAKQRFMPIHAITFDYGQRHRREIAAAQTVGQLAGVASHEGIIIGGTLQSLSPLTDPAAQLETYPGFAEMDRIIGSRIELTFVPMRNLLFLTIAANRAVALDCRHIIIGVSQEDNANYPDCRLDFIRGAEELINTALGYKWGDGKWISIDAPLIKRDKATTVMLACALDGCLAALAYSHTCYAGAFPPCGECHACVLRAHGFAQAQVTDPLIARAAALTGVEA
jgi:7-cyano-7-deazaguanine synthase